MKRNFRRLSTAGLISAITVGDEVICIKDNVREAIDYIHKSKDFIRAAVSSEPHGALAWAGVTLLLPVSIT